MELTEERSETTGESTNVALLRGINVGGQRPVKMAELKHLFETLGYRNVRTYIQSGNVIFTSKEAEAPLRERLEREIATAFGFPVTVVVRTAEELAGVVTRCPYPTEALPEDASLYVALLAEAPSEKGVARLDACDVGPDECRLVGCDMYLLYRQSMRDTKLTNSLLERLRGVAATSRNWRTITTLTGMCAALKASERAR